MPIRIAALVALLCCSASGLAQNASFNDKPSADDVKFFEAKIRPVLIEQCYSCHSQKTEKLKGGLLLDTRVGVQTGGDSGAIIVPGKPAASILIKAIQYKDESLQMPPKKKLPDAVIADFEQWVKRGAPDPRDGGAVSAKATIDIEKGREFWAFQNPKPSPKPDVKAKNWPKGEADWFVLAGLESKGLKPVGDADRRTLVRRVYLDLTGLPPPPDVVEAFAFDGSAKAYEAIVDRLLASPQFGERWARHWLDVARYAESSGKTVNFNYPHAWRYRDYVIAALNADKPYDQFVREQLAGDLLPSANDKQKAERIIATGFLAIGPKSLDDQNRLQFELDIADEQIDVTTQAFLGLTAACARCHDHKFDPIPTKDYYALAGIFRSSQTCYGTIRTIQSNHPSPLVKLPPESAPSSLAEKLSTEERKRIEASIASIRKKMEEQEPIQNIFNFAQITLMRSKLDSYEADGTPKLQAMGMQDRLRPYHSPIYNRGEPDLPGPIVPRGGLQVVGKAMPAIQKGSGRLELANWIASKDNPLTARVMVNRVWLHLFGAGIVPTSENFGAAGRPPTNPQLLDHLAISFMAEGWSVKKLIRSLVLSRTYQLASTHHAANFEADPDNTLLWRCSPRRLDAEAIRDSMLAVAGKLESTPPVGSPIAHAGEGPTGRARLSSAVRNDPNDPHRAIYLPIIRDNLPESLSLFDAADPSLVVAERATTTVPAQSLYLLNNPFVQKMSDAAADRLIKKTSAESDRIREGYLLFFGRPPSDKELTAAEAFLEKYRKTIAKDRTPPKQYERATWSAFCQALFGSAEFLFRN